MYIVDSHCDSIGEVDSTGCNLVMPHNFSNKYPQLQFVAMFCCHSGETEEECYRRAVRYVGHFAIQSEAEKQSFVPVRTYADIERAFASGKHAALLTIEGGSGIKSSAEEFRKFYNVGVRVFGMAWLSNSLAKSNRLSYGEEDTGLTPLGREIINEGNRLGMIFDVSHLSDKSFWDTMELAAKPPIASHSNFRALCPHGRNLTDDMAKALIARGGMIGLNFYPPFITKDGDGATVEELFKHAEHCLEIGGENNIGFGGDVDGTSGHYPSEIDQTRSIHDQLVEFMLRHNYSEKLAEKIAYKNYMNYLRVNLT